MAYTFLGFQIYSSIREPFADIIGKWMVFFAVFAIALFSASRLGLIVLIFYCFSSTPASVYETVKWTKYLPHFQ
jgi:hypothetical protein